MIMLYVIVLVLRPHHYQTLDSNSTPVFLSNPVLNPHPFCQKILQSLVKCMYFLNYLSWINERKSLAKTYRQSLCMYFRSLLVPWKQ